MCVGENYAFCVSHDGVMAGCGFACLRGFFFPLDVERTSCSLLLGVCVASYTVRANSLKLSLFKVVHLGKKC